MKWILNIINLICSEIQSKLTFNSYLFDVDEINYDEIDYDEEIILDNWFGVVV